MAYFCNKPTIFNIVLLDTQCKHNFLCSVFNKIWRIGLKKSQKKYHCRTNPTMIFQNH